MSDKISINIKDLQAQQQILSNLSKYTDYNQKQYSALMKRLSDAVTGKMAVNIQLKSILSIMKYIALSTDLKIGADVAQKCIDAFYSTDQDIKEQAQNMNQVLITITGGNADSQNQSNQTIYEDLYEQYREAVEKINNAVPIGQTQQIQAGVGDVMCTYAATTTLLQRKQASDGTNPSFTFDDVYRANGGKGKQNADGSWPNDSSFYFTRTYKNDDSSYTMSCKSGPTNADSVRALLDEHPEGIVIYSTHGYGVNSKGETYAKNHAIVITDYEVNSDGSIQFYADDPVSDRSDKGRIKLEDTWLASMDSDIFGTAVFTAWFD